jgi:hypothetical protein
MAVIYSKWLDNIHRYEPFPLQGPPKFTRIWIFGLKIYHLATLAANPNRMPHSHTIKMDRHDNAVDDGFHFLTTDLTAEK